MYPLVLFGNVKLVLLYTSSASNKSSLSYETNLHDDEIIILTIIIVKVMLANKHFKSNLLNAPFYCTCHIPHVLLPVSKKVSNLIYMSKTRPHNALLFSREVCTHQMRPVLQNLDQCTMGPL